MAKGPHMLLERAFVGGPVCGVDEAGRGPWAGPVSAAAVILNLVPVVLWMIRYFVRYALPEIPSQLGHSPYGLTALHAVVGAIGVVLGVFVALRGHELVPKALRFSDYKAFMRTAYVVYMAGTVLGVILYLILYAGL